MARSKMIMVRVDEAEHALFKEAARGVGISMSEYARDAMLARMALEQLAGVVEADPAAERVPVPVTRLLDPSPRVIESPADVPVAVERVSGRDRAREFTPYTKEQQTGKAQKRTKAAEPALVCRHGLLRCKVCGSW